MCIGVSVSMYVCGSCKSGVSRTKRTLNTLELQLHVVVSSHVDAENWIPGPIEEKLVLQTTEPPLQPPFSSLVLFPCEDGQDPGFFLTLQVTTSDRRSAMPHSSFSAW